MTHKLLSFFILLFLSSTTLMAQTPQDLIIGVTITPLPEEDSVQVEWPVQEAGDILINSLDHGTSKFIARINFPQNQTKIFVPRGSYRTLKFINTADQNQLQLICASNFFVQPPQKKKVLLLVTPLIDSGAVKEIDRWMSDVSLEGWTVEKRVINEDTPVPAVKDTIENIYNHSGDTPLNGVFLLGHIPVPYSGQLNPDGHENHLGAWPADGYYVDFNANYFTDVAVNTDESANPPSREENRNIPGDGKFDSSIFGSPVELWIGRVDLSNLPVYSAVDPSFDELFLTKRYLYKDHQFRSNAVRPADRAIIDDNFGYFSGEAFAANGWMVGKQFVADSLIEAGDFLSASTDRSYLWGYGCGGGTYTSAGGIGSSTDFANDSVNIVFSMLFGSYFGDWDSQNNFMRSAIASKGMLLTCAWAGRPDWFFPQMAANLPIGESAKLSMNADTKYSTSYAQKWVHMGLMGDPTLKVNNTLPPDDLTITGTGPTFTLSWTASPDPNIAYFIFRKTENDGNYVLLNKSPLSGTTYSDSTAAIGVNEYAVLAGSLVQNRSGIHYSVSNSIYSNVTFVVNGISHSTSKDYIDIAPNPSGSQASLLLNTSWSGRVQVSIVTLSGKEVHSFTVLNVGGLIKLPETPTGIYFVRTRSLENGKSAVRKWIVN